MNTSSQQRPPLPPFSLEDAVKKVRMAEDAWNTRDPGKVALAYTPDSEWRNRAEFLRGRDAGPNCSPNQSKLSPNWTGTS